MKTLINLTSLAILIMLFTIGHLFAQEHDHKHKTDIKFGDINTKKIEQYDKNKDGKIYRCAMHKNQISDKPGNCSKCGMKLSEISINVKDRPLMKGGKMLNLREAKAHKEKIAEAEKNNIVRKGIINVEAIDQNGDGKVYQDMMDWNVISDVAGDCPVCGMHLKEITVEDAKNNLIKNGYKVTE